MDYSDRMSMGNGMLEMAIFQKKVLFVAKQAKFTSRNWISKTCPKPEREERFVDNHSFYSRNTMILQL